MQALLALTAVLAAAGLLGPQVVPAAAASAPVSLPEGSVWIRGGIIRTQPDKLPIPYALRKADNVTHVFSLSPDYLLWTEELRDYDGTLIRFRLRLGDMSNRHTKDIITAKDPFNVGPGWRVLGANLSAESTALLVRIRLSGTGGHSAIYEVALEPPHEIAPAPEGSHVWESFSADGSVKVVDTWALTATGEHLPDSRRKYGSVIAAGLTTPGGRQLWTIERHDAIPPWAEHDITSAAVSPNGRAVLYFNPRGLWRAPISGCIRPTRQWPAPAGETCDQLVWAPDGSGVFFTRRPFERDPFIVFLRLGTLKAIHVLEQAEGLCVLMKE